MSETPSLQDSEKIESGLRDLLSRQFLLHEAPYRPEAKTPHGFKKMLRPIAHAPTDIYKCLHQGEFGIGHNIRNQRHFGARLVDDFFAGEPTQMETILEDISLDGNVFRLNLRSYRYLFQNKEKEGCELLFKVCLDSASVRTGDMEHFLEILSTFKGINNGGGFDSGGLVYGFPSMLIEDFYLEIRSRLHRTGTVPVFSHSPIYRRYNVPSYRVVDRAALENSPLDFLLDQI